MGILDNDKIKLKVKTRDNNSVVIYIDDVGNSELSSGGGGDQIEIDETTYQSDDDYTEASSITIKMESENDNDADASDNDIEDGNCTKTKLRNILYPNTNLIITSLGLFSYPFFVI